MTCGTGGWVGPLPGDPDNGSILTATAAFGGVDVSWTYPTTNPHAVAYTILWRGTTNNYAASVRLATVAGNFFYDKTTAEVTTVYYYWIQIVSVYGTVGATIGPASASGKPTITDMLTQLTGKIERGNLALALKGELDAIPGLEGDLAVEIADRIAAHLALSATVTSLNGQVVAAVADVNAFNIQRIADNGVLAADITAVSAGLGSDLAAVETDLTAVLEVQDGKVIAIGARYTAVTTVNGLIGGFGVYNDGTSVEAGFDVDTFWVGKSLPMWLTATSYTIGNIRSLGGANWRCILAHTSSALNKPPTLPTTVNTWWTIDNSRRKPFIIDADVVYMDQAAIKELTFTKLRDEANAVIVEDGKIKADKISTKGLSVTDASGNVILSAGSGLQSQIQINPNLVKSLSLWGLTGTASLNTSSTVAESGVTLVIPSSMAVAAHNSPTMVLASGTYTVSFRAYSSVSRVLNLDLFPDTLPQSAVTVAVGWAFYQVTWTSAHADMSNCLLRFFAEATPGDMEIGDIKIELGASRTMWVPHKLDQIGVDNKITGANISTYISSAAIGSAEIGTAAITNAKIGTAEITTLKVLGGSISTIVAQDFPTPAIVRVGALYSGVATYDCVTSTLTTTDPSGNGVLLTYSASVQPVPGQANAGTCEAQFFYKVGATVTLIGTTWRIETLSNAGYDEPLLKVSSDIAYFHSTPVDGTSYYGIRFTSLGGGYDSVDFTDVFLIVQNSRR